MSTRYFSILVSAVIVLFTATACEDAIKMTQLAQRGMKVAKSLNDDGESKDPKLRALQVAAKGACDQLVTCAEERERQEGELEDGELSDSIESLEAMCDASKLVVIHAQLSGKKCVSALTEQLTCFANAPCAEEGDNTDPCEEYSEVTEVACTQFWDSMSSDK